MIGRFAAVVPSCSDQAPVTGSQVVDCLAAPSNDALMFGVRPSHPPKLGAVQGLPAWSANAVPLSVMQPRMVQFTPLPPSSTLPPAVNGASTLESASDAYVT